MNRRGSLTVLSGTVCHLRDEVEILWGEAVADTLLLRRFVVDHRLITVASDWALREGDRVTIAFCEADDPAVAPLALRNHTLQSTFRQRAAWSASRTELLREAVLAVLGGA